MLPSRDPAPAAPSADHSVTLPPSDKSGSASRSASVSLQTRAERIRASTAAGGLDALPAGFDDSGGDWQVIEAASPFERLYLDAAQSPHITTSMVQKNYGLLRDFWNDKIAAMQTGSARTQILLKYGGVHRSEELLRSYPRELKKAADRLLAPDGIRVCRDELEAERRAAGRAKVQPLMDLILVDDSLEPVETNGFFTQAVAAGLELEEAAQMLHETILQRDFHPLALPEGDTLSAQLRSVQWVARARMAHVEAPAPAPPKKVVVTPPPPPPPVTVVAPRLAPPPAWMRTPAIPIAVVLIAALIIVASLNRGDAATPAPAPEPSVTATTSTTSATPVPTATTEAARVEKKPEEPRTDTAALELERLKKAAREEEQRRQEAATKEAEAAAARETERMNALHSEVADGIKRAGDALAARDYAAVRSNLNDTRAKAAAQPAIFASEIAEIDRILAAANTQETQEVLYRSRLKEIDELNGEKKYVEAMTIANRLLKEQDLPSEVAEHARASLATAQEALQKSSGSWIKSITTRRTNKGGGNR